LTALRVRPTMSAPTLEEMDRTQLRFWGSLLLFIGILGCVGILTALMVFPDPLAVPQSELLVGRLSILGAVATAGAVLLAVTAPRAGYRWFDGALFFVPVYGQVVFAPRVLWRASRSRAGRFPSEPSPRPPGEGAWRASPGPEIKEPPDPEKIREEARTLAALLSGRGHITLPEAKPSNGPAAAVAPTEPGKSPLEAPPEELVRNPPAEPAPSSPRRARRVLMIMVLAVLVLWAVAVPLVGAWLLQQERHRVERLANRSTELSASVTDLRTELSLIRAELVLLRQELESLQEEVRAPKVRR
jgi:uncharacterized coiled-coil protein SlyX